MGHECLTVPEAGFAGKRNGALLTLAESAGFDALVTVDKGIEYEQNLLGRRIGVVILHIKSNKLEHLRQHVGECMNALASIKPGQIVKVGRR